MNTKLKILLYDSYKKIYSKLFKYPSGENELLFNLKVIVLHRVDITFN